MPKYKFSLSVACREYGIGTGIIEADNLEAARTAVNGEIDYDFQHQCSDDYQTLEVLSIEETT